MYNQNIPNFLYYGLKNLSRCFDWDNYRDGQLDLFMTITQLNGPLVRIDDGFILGYQFIPRISSISCPFITIMFVGNSRPTKVTGMWKATSLVNIRPPGEWIINLSLDSVQCMQCFSTKFLLMKVCDAPRSKRITAGMLATRNTPIITGSPSGVVATWV
jgi:hypothetical protein